MSKTYVVTSAIIKNGDKFFIAKRADTKHFAPGKWEFISGFIEEAEPAEQTILRELQEEINATGKIEKSLPPYFFYDDGENWLVIPFVVSVEDINIKTDPAEHSKGKWVTFEEIGQIPDLADQAESLKKML